MKIFSDNHHLIQDENYTVLTFVKEGRNVIMSNTNFRQFLSFLGPVFEQHSSQIDDRLAKLRALEDAGVDNWGGYSEAMRTLHSEDD